MRRFYEKSVKRVLLSTLIVLYSVICFATTYYVSSTGNDANSGLSTTLPWKTLSKVNSASFMPGDQILFSRSDTFCGSLTISSSGTSSSRIVVGAYGTGANPIITGFTTVSSWTSLGGNIWESNVVSTLSTCNMVTINGVNTAMGRYPNAGAANSGYLNFQSHSGYTSISSSSLSGTPNWTGAEIAMRDGHFMIERCVITSQSGGTLVFSPGAGYEPTDGYGFFIQNDVRTLDVQNEWYYNPTTKKLRVYSLSQPVDVKVATISNLLTVYGHYVTVNGLDFKGSNADNIVGNGTHTTIQNCNVSFSGMNHILTPGAYYTIIDNTFTDTNNNGISVEGSHSNISRNILTNNGIFQGMGRSGGYGINSALSVGGGGTVGFLIQDNKVINSGFNGIAFYGDSVYVKNNYINTFCNILDDGAGIYTYTGIRPLMRGAKIEGNIVMNGTGDVNGTSGTFPTIAAGIYCDETSANVEIFNNSIANCHQFGIFLNVVSNINIHHNTVYNTTVSQIEGSWSSNILINNNILVAKLADQYCLYFSSGTSPAIPSWVSSDYNYYARPIDDNKVFYIEQPGVGNFMNLVEWQSFTGKDFNSHKSPQSVASVNDLRFEYNETKVAKTIALSTPMIDVKGTKYSTSVILQPYTSVVLMKDNSAPTTIVTVTSVSVSPTSASISASSTQQLTATVLPTNATNKTVTWSSINTSVATVNSLGLVTGVSAGTALITATTQDGSKTAASSITVNTFNSTGSAIGQNSIGSISESGISGNWIASSFTSGSSTTVNRMNLYVSNASGTARLGIYADNSGTPGALLAQTGDISLINGWNSGALGLAKNLSSGVTYWLAYEVSSSATTVQYNSSAGRSKYISYLYGTLPAPAPANCGTGTGIYSIYADNNGASGTVLVTGVTISPISASMGVGTAQQLTATILPSNATNKLVSWTSSNTLVATVSNTGLVTGVAGGNATIKVTTQDGGKTSTCAITVRILVTGVTISPTSASLIVGATQQLTATISPSNATNKMISWSSSNPLVATVNSAGLVTGVSAGSASVTVTTQDGLKTASCAITIASNVVSGYLGYKVKGLTTDASGAGDMNASQFTASSSFTASTMYVSMPAVNCRIKGAIYSDNNGTPGIKLGETLEITNPTVSGFQQLTGLNVPIVNGTKYWLVVWGSAAYRVDCETAGGISRWKASQIYGSWPSTFATTDGSSALKYSIYVESGIKSAFLNESALTSISPDIAISEIVKIDLYPNPSKGNFTVRFSELPEIGSRIDILDISGRRIVTRIISETSEEFDLNQQPNGIYIVKSVLGSKEVTSKLILNR